MKKLFDRVLDGASEMMIRAERSIDEVEAKCGPDAPVQLPETAYNCAVNLAYKGTKISKVSDLRDALEIIQEMIKRRQSTEAIFNAGIATAMSAELIEACKYVETPTPYEGTKYHGHFSHAEVRELGVPLVTGDIPGFVVLIDEAPTDEQAAELIKGYQSRGIFVFLIGKIIDQAELMGINMGFPVRVVAVGQDIWTVSHIISFCDRAAMIFGAIEPGDWDGFQEYTFVRLRAFVNAFKPVRDMTVACGGGAIALGFPVITNDTENMWRVPKSLIIQENLDYFI